MTPLTLTHCRWSGGCAREDSSNTYSSHILDPKYTKDEIPPSHLKIEDHSFRQVRVRPNMKCQARRGVTVETSCFDNKTGAGRRQKVPLSNPFVFSIVHPVLFSGLMGGLSFVSRFYFLKSDPNIILFSQRLPSLVPAVPREGHPGCPLVSP